MGFWIDRAITSGFTSFGDRRMPLENNVWVIGDDVECVVIDAPHAVQPVLDTVGNRRVQAVLCTHGHSDHINAAVEVGTVTRAPVLLHPADRMLWDRLHDTAPDGDLADGQVFTVAEIALHVRHTPGHTPGSICIHAPDLGVLFSGDTLFLGGPGATGRPFSSFDQIIASIRDRLLTLPAETIVHAGHGESTTIGREASSLPDWIARGY
ncbi:MAG TPA: MBL fold metallo-hydrolase [Mycobacteriales bacterium]|jgi:glyoxylase-like metal-dependent hydrolase (beta-lactamase superfamily II)|nr:MBL fold metallo-hydrolase [Mycobacteriales bacterium]